MQQSFMTTGGFVSGEGKGHMHWSIFWNTRQKLYSYKFEIQRIKNISSQQYGKIRCV